MKAVFRVILAALLICGVLASVGAAGAVEETARDLTGEVRIWGTGYKKFDFLTDGNTTAYYAARQAVITLECDTPMAGLYLRFDLEFGEYTITDLSSGQHFTAGQHGFLHEYVDLEAAFGTAPTAVTLDFSDGRVRLSEITVYDRGILPDSVQTWAPPLEGGADLVLFSAHGDDEHLFFAGLLPTYAAERGYRVQVVYLTDHRNDTYQRTHEMLNGLWKVGVRAYPVFGRFADFRVDSLKGTYDRYSTEFGTSREELLGYVVEQIRRFRPLVAVGHDLKGEYGHGMHRVYADLLTQAVGITADETAYPDSARRYGVWEIPKLYLHLYGTDPITIDYDQPLTAFDGMTAFAVSQKIGFPSHRTQQLPKFVKWLYGEDRNITKASQIEKYNPCIFGLYHTTAGEDVAKNDFFENIISYAQQEQLELERLEQERLEQERLEKERLEKERQEQERLEKERLEQQRQEQERLEQERLEMERLEQLRLAQEARRKRLILLCTAVGIAAVITAVLLHRRFRCAG
jgi:LmbE family N-acetylglucosaminyl deacetylase